MSGRGPDARRQGFASAESVEAGNARFESRGGGTFKGPDQGSFAEGGKSDVCGAADGAPDAAVAKGGFAGRAGSAIAAGFVGELDDSDELSGSEGAYRAGRAAADIRKRRRARLRVRPVRPCGGYRQRRCRRGKGGEARRRGSQGRCRAGRFRRKRAPLEIPAGKGQGRPWRQGRPPICRHRRKGCRRQRPGRGPGRVQLCQVARRPAGRRGGARRSEGRIRRKARGGRLDRCARSGRGPGGRRRLRSSEPHPLDAPGRNRRLLARRAGQGHDRGPSRLHHLRHGARGAGVPGGVRASRRLHHRAGHLRERPGRRHEPAGHQGPQPLRHQVGIELRQLPGGRRQGELGHPRGGGRPGRHGHGRLHRVQERRGLHQVQEQGSPAEQPLCGQRVHQGGHRRPRLGRAWPRA